MNRYVVILCYMYGKYFRNFKYLLVYVYCFFIYIYIWNFFKNINNFYVGIFILYI